MPITKAKKVEILNVLNRDAVASPALVFLNFHGLTVAEGTGLRKALREAGVRLLVAKKTLLRRAFGAAGIAGDLPSLDGEVAVAFLGEKRATDTTAPARVAYAFAKTHGEHLKLLGGVFEGKYLDGAATLGLATIPSREILLGQLVGLLQSPLRRLAVALNQVASAKTA